MVPKATAQRLAIGFLVLAAFDMIVGQKTLAMIFAVLAIAISLGAGVLARGKSKTGKGR